MGKRVILGARGGDMGLFVSAPTKDADSTVFEDLLVDTSRINTQPIFKGQVINPVMNYDYVNDKDIQVNNVYSYDPLYNTYYYVPTVVGDGYATYSMDVLTHNLGYIPLCHISIGSPEIGAAYPQVYLTTTKLYLRYRERRTAQTGWNGAAYVTAPADINHDRPSTRAFTFTMNYTIFRQQAV